MRYDISCVRPVVPVPLSSSSSSSFSSVRPPVPSSVPSSVPSRCPSSVRPFPSVPVRPVVVRPFRRQSIRFFQKGRLFVQLNLRRISKGWWQLPCVQVPSCLGLSGRGASPLWNRAPGRGCNEMLLPTCFYPFDSERERQVPL